MLFSFTCILSTWTVAYGPWTQFLDNVAQLTLNDRPPIENLLLLPYDKIGIMQQSKRYKENLLKDFKCWI